MYACRACGALYLSQREADLCTPASEIEARYGPQYKPGSAFLEMEV